MITSQS